MNLFKRNDINTRGICNKKKTWYGFDNIFPLLIYVLLVQQTNCLTCASPKCLVGYDARTMPNPSTESDHGQCGRHCKFTWICDPCQILNSTAGNYYDMTDLCIEKTKYFENISINYIILNDPLKKRGKYESKIGSRGCLPDQR